MEHNHNHHEKPAPLKNLIFAMVINGGIVAFEMVFGLLIQSMAMISDTVHNLSDIAAMGFSYLAEKVTKMNALSDIKPLQDQRYSKRSEMRLLWLERTPDQKKILTVQKEFRTLRDKLNDKQTVYRLEAQKFLTPEQQAQAQTYGTGRGYVYGSDMRGHGGMGMRGY